MSDIKNKLIKIAYENPELRGELLRVILANEEPEPVEKWFIGFNGGTGHLHGLGIPCLCFYNDDDQNQTRLFMSPIEKVEKHGDSYIVTSRSGKKRLIEMKGVIVDQMEKFYGDDLSKIVHSYCDTLIKSHPDIYGLLEDFLKKHPK